MKEILEDFAVLRLLLLSLLLSFSFRTSTAWPLFPTTHFCLGIFCHLFYINGAISVLSDGDFVYAEENRVGMKAAHNILVSTVSGNGAGLRRRDTSLACTPQE